MKEMFRAIKIQRIQVEKIVQFLFFSKKKKIIQQILLKVAPVLGFLYHLNIWYIFLMQNNITNENNIILDIKLKNKDGRKLSAGNKFFL